MTLSDYLDQFTAERPHLCLPVMIDRATWPLYQYVHHGADQLDELFEAIAAARQATYVPSTEDRAIGLVNVALNSTQHNALESGVLWIREERVGTPQVTRVGATFHPLLCGPTIMLMEPREWQHLLHRMFPTHKLEYGDAQYLVTYTAAVDRADSQLLTSDMRQAILRLERGIESGSPQHSQVDPEATALLSEDFQRERHVIPFKYDRVRKILHIFMSDVNDHETIRTVERVTHAQPKIVHMEREDEDAYWMLRGLASFAAQQEDEMLRSELLSPL